MSNTTKKNGAFIGHYAAGMVHFRDTANGRKFASISINVPESKTGYGTISVNVGQLLPARKMDGTIVDNRYTILLGDRDKSRKVSICTKKKTKTKPAEYATITLTNGEIADMVAEARAAYAEAQAAQATDVIENALP